MQGLILTFESINGYITLRSLIYKTYHFYVVPQIYLDGITFFACQMLVTEISSSLFRNFYILKCKQIRIYFLNHDLLCYLNLINITDLSKLLASTASQCVVGTSNACS